MNTKQKTRYLFQMISLLSLVFIFSLIIDCKGGSKEDAAKDTTATVTFIKGSVKINDRDVKVGETVADFSSIATGENSICEITFGKNNIIQMQADTLMSLVFSNIVKQVDLKKGSIASILKGMEKQTDKDNFRVRTNTTVAGVRGTTFFVHTDPKSTYICGCNGSVNVSDIHSLHSELLNNAHHGARVFSLAKGKIKVEEGKLEYHNDKMMEDLAAKINYKVDWNKPD